MGDKVVLRSQPAHAGETFRLLLAVDAYRAESVELSSLADAQGRSLTLQFPDERATLSGELSLITIPPVSLYQTLFGGHSSAQSCTGHFALHAPLSVPVHKLNVVLVTDVADSPAVELHVSVRCTAGKSASEPVKSTPPTAEAPAPVAESQQNNANAETRRAAAPLGGADGPRFRSKEFIGHDHAAATELALKFCNRALDTEKARVISITERPFG